MLRWFGHKYVKCLSKHPDSFFQGFYDQQYCYTCQKASWMTAKHTKCGSKSVIFLLSITLIYSCIFFTTVHFSDKRDGALYIYLRFYILPYLLVLFLAYHPYISFHFWGLFFLFIYRQLCSGRWCVTVVVDCGFVQCYWESFRTDHSCPGLETIQSHAQLCVSLNTTSHVS